MHPSATVDLTVVLPVLNERDNLAALLPRLDGVLRQLDCTYEVLVVDGGSADGTADLARRLGSRVIVQRSPGYGGALREGFAAAAGEYVLTLDADLSHDPDFVAKLWRSRTSADIVIASRYVKAGVAYMPVHRSVLSRVLNRFFALGLGLPLRDLSSGFRLYRAALLSEIDLQGRNFDVLCRSVTTPRTIDGPGGRSGLPRAPGRVSGGRPGGGRHQTRVGGRTLSVSAAARHRWAGLNSSRTGRTATAGVLAPR